MNPEEVQRTFEIAEYCTSNFGDKPLFYQKRANKWQPLSCCEYQSQSEQFALGLLALGVEKGDFVATVFNVNCPQWNVLDMALSMAGAVHVPVYPTISDSDYLYILNQSEARFVFVGDQAAYNRVSVLQSRLPILKQIFTVEKLANVENFNDILELGAGPTDESIEELRARKSIIQPDDVVSIIYTSGSTGFPKGVMLTHQNLVSNTFAAAEIQPLGNGSRILSFLPLCHVYERTANYQFQIKGAQIFYCENMKSLMNNFLEIRPHGTSVVPRVLEKIIKVVLISAKKRKFVVRWVINWAVKFGLKFSPYSKKKPYYTLSHKFAYWAVFRRVRASLGGRLRYIGCGGAPLNNKVQRFFWACRLPVYEGYGLTEGSPLVSLNYPGKGNYWIGSVGPAVQNVEVKIDEDGEILVKGPNVMKGYFKQEKLTRETIVDGWLHTGDIGELIREKYLKITGRKKQMFKTSYGKYVVPQAIENKFAGCPLIDNLMVIGEGKHCAGAIISPDFDYIRSNHRISNKLSNQKIIEMARIKNAVQNEVNKVNNQLGKTEQIKKYLLVPDVWSAETGELSHTMKLRRNSILRKYKRKIHLLYKNESI